LSGLMGGPFNNVELDLSFVFDVIATTRAAADPVESDGIHESARF